MLQKLKNLKEAGILTEKEFEIKKKKENNSGKKTGQELVGVVLVLLIFLNSDEPLQYLSKRMNDNQITNDTNVTNPSFHGDNGLSSGSIGINPNSSTIIISTKLSLSFAILVIVSVEDGGIPQLQEEG